MSLSGVFVTGASGNVGRPLVRRLLAAGVPVRVGARTPERERWPDGVEVVRFDFADPSSFAPAVVGIDRMFLLRPPRRFYSLIASSSRCSSPSACSGSPGIGTGALA